MDRVTPSPNPNQYLEQTSSDEEANLIQDLMGISSPEIEGPIQSTEEVRDQILGSGDLNNEEKERLLQMLIQLQDIENGFIQKTVNNLWR